MKIINSPEIRGLIPLTTEAAKVTVMPSSTLISSHQLIRFLCTDAFFSERYLVMTEEQPLANKGLNPAQGAPIATGSLRPKQSRTECCRFSRLDRQIRETIFKGTYALVLVRVQTVGTRKCCVGLTEVFRRQL